MSRQHIPGIGAPPTPGIVERLEQLVRENLTLQRENSDLRDRLDASERLRELGMERPEVVLTFRPDR